MCNHLDMEITTDKQENSVPQEIVEQVKALASGIEYAHKKLTASLGDEQGVSKKHQIARQTSMVPVILLQLSRMLENLVQKFGEVFIMTCSDEIQEILAVAARIQRVLENSAAGDESDDVQDMFSSIARLNLLQQRISGKMMKVKAG